VTSIERVAALAASILTQPELEAWAMRATGMTYREMHQLYIDEGQPVSLSTIHAAYQRAEAKLRTALEAA
jgi:hypothetical protein